MMHTQFQDEPTPVATGAERLTDESTNASHGAELLALALGLSLQRGLTHGEKDYLDRLAPPGALTFVVCDGCYLHPDGVELFPLEVIETAVNLGGQAIFSHHYRPDDGDCHAYEIHTSLVSRNGEDNIVLGMFRPENVAGLDEFRNRFADLILRFRRAMQSVAPVARRLTEILKSGVPAIVVDRISGRVLETNKGAGRYLESDVSGLAGVDTFELKKLLADTAGVGRTAIQNISEAGLELSVMTFPQTGAAAPGVSLSALALDEGRGGLNRIIRSAMEPVNDNYDDAVRPPVELFREITRQADIAAGSLSGSPRARSHSAEEY